MAPTKLVLLTTFCRGREISFPSPSILSSLLVSFLLRPFLLLHPLVLFILLFIILSWLLPVEGRKEG
jgi:hypothetical protein